MITYLQNLILKSPNQLISYADFIATALYHPEFGYYMTEKQKIGRQGDFITTSNISDVYGRLMAKWFSVVCKKNNLPPNFCEIGAGNGRFAKAFLQEWTEKINMPLQYLIIETSPYHRKLQSEVLNSYPSVRQMNDVTDLKSFEGIIFSNELFDALPVHVIEKENGTLNEIMVGLKNQQLVEHKIPLANQDILSFLEKNQSTLHEGQRMEIPLAMDVILKQISSSLTRGIVVTADYGYTTEEWQDPRRSRGSLRGYYQHKMIDNVLVNPGEMDITTHIHFDHLIKKGEQFDLQFITKLRQDEFLLKAGILKELEDHYDPNPFSEIGRRNRAIRSLIMPGGISSFFQIVIQQKGLVEITTHLFEG
ncbi:class I SAM-dependent methyltransferase [Neobacillus kokaensis]|uniref:SAM-dependent methyltransferase n=1 Tax=Neobacillus kokaensis TaxID=2759023 RepID=A0ABQ3N0E6_9BACI|nr:SAM-dependent methyltransferase [Neobacillus kokaensis]GHH96978.1 SAM-dependent methyltransferase [Neobacillus kokaensis]